MTEQAGYVLQELFSAFWGLFDFVVPGTTFTAQEISEERRRDQK